MVASNNSTESGNEKTTTVTTTTAKDIYRAIYEEHEYYLDLYVYPILSILGIVGNIYSLVVIKRLGLKKSSDILVFWTALYCTVFLFGTNNIVGILMEHRNMRVYYTLLDTYVWYGSYLAWHGLKNIAKFCMTITPIFMVIERLIVLFFPLHVQTIITKPRLWSVCILPTLVYTAYIIAYFWHYYEIGMYCHPAWGGLCLGVIFVKNRDPIWFEIDKYFLNNIGSVSIITVFIGTVIIGIMVARTTIVKNKMITVYDKRIDAAASRTTKKLLLFCVTYCIVEGIQYGVGIFTRNNKQDSYLSGIAELYQTMLLVLYCSISFGINFVMNPKFKSICFSTVYKWAMKAKARLH